MCWCLCICVCVCVYVACATSHHHPRKPETPKRKATTFIFLPLTRENRVPAMTMVHWFVNEWRGWTPHSALPYSSHSSLCISTPFHWLALHKSPAGDIETPWCQRLFLYAYYTYSRNIQGSIEWFLFPTSSLLVYSVSKLDAVCPLFNVRGLCVLGLFCPSSFLSLSSLHFCA